MKEGVQDGVCRRGCYERMRMISFFLSSSSSPKTHKENGRHMSFRHKPVAKQICYPDIKSR
jgi:hypothetical protein